MVGANEQNCIFAGQTASSGAIGIYSRVNNAYEKYNQSDIILPQYASSELEFTCENGVYSLTYNNQTITLNTATITSRNWQKLNIADTTFSDVIILPL